MKKILAFTLALAMVLATWTPTFAASKEVEALANLKLLLNTTDKEVNADLTRAVGLAMVLKALGYTQEDANAKAKDNTFVDMDKAAWAKGFAVLGEEMKITNGTSVEPKKFSPNWKLNERAFVAFMLRALGYDVDAAWAKAGELAKEAMIAETVSENKLTKGEAAVIMYKALKAKVQGDEKGRTLAQKLVDEKKLDKELAVANELIAAEPEKLELVSASADNLVQVVVALNGTPKKADAEKASNYRIKNVTVKDAKLVDKNVVLTVTKMTNKKEYELTVAKIKNEAGVEMDKQTVKFTASDVTIPSVTDVVVTGPKQFTVKFSEPLDLEPTVKVAFGKSSYTAAAKPAFAKGNTEIAYEISSNMKEGKEYIVKVGETNGTGHATDFAGLKSIYFEHAFTYAKDTTAPEAKVVKATQKEVTLEFTKPVKGLKKEHFYHTFTARTPLGYKDKDGKFEADFSKLKDPQTQIVLVFSQGTTVGNALPAGTVNIVVRGKVGSDKVEDNWGNLLVDAELPVVIEADREAPTVTAVETKANGKTVKVTFNEGLKNDKVSFKLLNADGKEVEKKDVTPNAGDKDVEVTFDKVYTGKTMTLSVSGARDDSLYENVMSEYTESISFTDKELKDLSATKFEFFKTSKDENARYLFYVTFPEEMSDTVLDPENYEFSATTPSFSNYKLKGSFDFLEGDRKTVVIELDKSKDSDVSKIVKTDNADYSNDAFELADGLNVKFSNKISDLAGNTAGAFATVASANITAKLASDGFTLDTVKAVAKNQVEVKFNKDIKDFDDDAKFWTLKKKTTDTVAAEVDFVSRKDGSNDTVVLYLKEGKELATNVMFEGKAVQVNLKTGNTFTDVFDRKAAAKEVDVTDAIAPERTKITKAAVDHNSDLTVFQNGTVKQDHANVDMYAGKPRATVVRNKTDEGTFVYIAYSEEISKDSVSNTIFTVSEGWTVETATVLDAKKHIVKLKISKKDGKVEELQKLTVKQVGAIRDAAQGVLHQDNQDVELLYIEQTGAELGNANETFENGIQ